MAVRVLRPEQNAPIQDEYLARWTQRRQDGLSHRRQFEVIWDLCQLFLAGKQWVGLSSRGSRVLVEEPNPQGRERYTINTIKTHHQTMLGKLFVEDLRPDILQLREDLEADENTSHARAVGRFLWENEVDADRKLYTAIHKMLTFGTAAIRTYFDNTQGVEIMQAPKGPDGKPMLDPMQARAYVAETAAQGQQVELMPIRDGRIVWEPLGPRSIIPPPGVEDPEYFPWIVLDRVMAVPTARLRWPDKAMLIQEQDLRATEAGTLIATDDQGYGTNTGALKDHCIISTGYEMPSPDFPRGHVCNWTGDVKLDETNELPYSLKRQPHSGVFFLRYHREESRFWGTGVVEPQISPQRQKNRARSQHIEMKDRNLGRVYAKKGTITAKNRPEGKIMELIEVPLHADMPVETNGVPPGSWIAEEAQICDEDMAVAAGLRGEASLTDPPTGVSAYAALALLSEQDERRVGPVLKEMRMQISDACLVSLEMARKFWMNGKHMAIAGPERTLQVVIYERSKLPKEFYMQVSKAAPMPTSPAAEAQKIFDVYHAAIAAGAPPPPEWLLTSLEAGKALPFPRREEQVHQRKAEVENWLMQQGQLLQPDYYDDDYIHIQVHRQEEINQAPTGNQQLLMLLEQHIQMHTQSAQMKGPGQTNNVPQLQGGHGIEAQSGANVDNQGAAQTASGTAPVQQPQAAPTGG